MANTIKTLLVLLFIFQLDSNAQATDGFILSGKINGLKDGLNIYLVDYETNKTVSTTTVKDGAFRLDGKVPNGTKYYYLRLDTTISKNGSDVLFLVNGTMELKGELADWPKIDLIGSEPQDEFLQTLKLWNEVHDNGEETKAQLDSFINQHLNSMYIGYVILKTDKEIFSYDQKKTYYNKLTARAKSSYFGLKLRKFLDLSKTWQQIVEGNTIPDFVITNDANKEQSIKELVSRNHCTLIFFWASYATPVRQEQISNIKKVYDAFHDKGFGVVSISTDKNIADWKGALVEGKMPWINCIDLKDIAADIFDIHLLPTFVLLDKKGSLVAFQAFGSNQIDNFGPSLVPSVRDDLYRAIETLIKQSK